MLLANWWFSGLLSVALIMIALAIYGLEVAPRIPHLLVRVGVRIVCASVALLASLIAILFVAASGVREPLGPNLLALKGCCGPNRKCRRGATGGETSVELFWAHGFQTQTVYDGEWKTVEPSDIRWTSDTELTIHYSGIMGYNHHYESTARVTVSCLQK
jgi:hypothetical protein